jgi:hypothetical protein
MTGHNPPCPKVAKGQICAPCEELAAIDQEIVTLKAKRIVICGRINHAHDPLTSKLPPEIVANIFTNLLPVDVDAAYGVSVRRPRHHSITNPLSLGAVCTAWRAIAWSTPQLWTSISLCLTYITEPRCTILRDWLSRSGELPLYIYIYEVNHMYNAALVKEIMALFALHSHKWFYSEFDIDEEHHHHLNSIFAGAHTLNTVKIGICDTPEMNLGMIPNLRKLYLDGPYVGYLLDVKWQKITNVEATFPSINMCLLIFSNAPCLEHCTFCIEGRTPTRNTGATRTKILQHDHLAFLHIKEWNTDTDTVLRLMRLPALQHLTVDSDGRVDVTTIAGFLRRSKCSLKFLDVNIECCTPEDTLQLFSPLADIPSLKNLELRCSYPAPTCYSIDDLQATRKRLRKTV